MTEALLPAVYRRLAACPWVRPEAVARGRARLRKRPLPTGEELAHSLLEWVFSAPSH